MLIGLDTREGPSPPGHRDLSHLVKEPGISEIMPPPSHLHTQPSCGVYVQGVDRM